jgi:hypothetical protein
MNKARIKELLESTGLEVAVYDGDNYCGEGFDFNDFELLTESVVKRIDLILANEYLDCVGENDKKSQFRIDRLRERINAYFGVEE